MLAGHGNARFSAGLSARCSSRSFHRVTLNFAYSVLSTSTRISPPSLQTLSPNCPEGKPNSHVQREIVFADWFSRRALAFLVVAMSKFGDLKMECQKKKLPVIKDNSRCRLLELPPGTHVPF